MTTSKKPIIDSLLSSLSRRDLFRTIGIATGGAMLLGMPKFLGSWVGDAEAASLRADYYPRVMIALELDNKFVCFLESVAGGNPYVEIVKENLGLSQQPQKRQGPVKFEDIVIEISLNDDLKPLAAWINDTQTRSPASKNGAIVYADVNGNEVKRLEFFNAFLTEFAMETADAREDRDAVSILLRLTPESIRFSGGKGKLQGSSVGAKSKTLRNAAFRFNVQGLEKACARIVKVQGIGYKRKLSIEQTGDMRRGQAVPASLDFTTVSLLLPETDAAPFYQWFEDVAFKGKQGGERGGLLEWLDPAPKGILASVQLGGLGIVRYAPEPIKGSGSGATSLVQIDMYCQALTVTV